MMYSLSVAPNPSLSLFRRFLGRRIPLCSAPLRGGLTALRRDLSSATLETKSASPFEGITLEEILRGSQQAYYAMGVVLGELTDAIESTDEEFVVKDARGMRSGMPLSTAGDLDLALQKHFPEQLRNWSPNFLSVETAPPSSSALTALLPVSESFSHWIGGLYQEHKKKLFNLLEVSGPHDYIVDSRILSGGCVVDKKPKPLKSLQDVPRTTDELDHSSSGTPVSEEESSVEEQLQDVIQMTLQESVDDPTAYLIIRHAVVQPPARTSTNYEWFYPRICDQANENERVFVARLFGVINSGSLYMFKLFDFVLRMIFAQPLKIGVTPTIKKKLNVPADAVETIPVTEKDAHFIRNSKGEWILSYLKPVVGDLPIRKMSGVKLS